MKDDLALVWSDEDVDRGVVAVLKDPGHLEETLRRNDHLDLRVDAIEQPRVPHRQTVRVGGCHGDHVAGQRREHSGEDRPAIVGRRDERDLADHPTKGPLRHAGRWLLGNLRNDRKFLRIHALDVRLVGARSQMHGLGPHVQRELHVARRKRVHEVDEELGGHRDRALVLDLRRHPAIDAHLEIRGRQAKATGVRAEQNVPEDRQASPSRDPSPCDPKPMRQVLL